MLHDNMNISRLMVYARRVEEARAQRKSRDAKIAKSFDGGFSLDGYIFWNITVSPLRNILPQMTLHIILNQRG